MLVVHAAFASGAKRMESRTVIGATWMTLLRMEDLSLGRLWGKLSGRIIAISLGRRRFDRDASGNTETDWLAVPLLDHLATPALKAVAVDRANLGAEVAEFDADGDS